MGVAQWINKALTSWSDYFDSASEQESTPKQKELDEVVVKAAPEWPIEKIANVDRNVLRLGLAELLFSDHAEVPPKVAINEAPPNTILPMVNVLAAWLFSRLMVWSILSINIKASIYF